ncbi:hypothetical protein AY601_2958 [Pedobacter cryoconitis]|uniref:Uncharacterized protein n=2 Tax=Pedobacter cryoconitis TaxID=188932 RepID=A0A127VER6_9SPHI|nr:hypothetical protein AY601_2958 [Pedobacter cryoconitis]
MKISQSMGRLIDRWPGKISGLTLLCMFFISNVQAQLPIKIVDGKLIRDDGTFGKFQTQKYTPLVDSLNKSLKLNPKDTTSLFIRSTLYLFSNDVQSKPNQREKGTLENLILAKDMVENAVSYGMQDIRLKILRAQIYRELVYRFTGDESWMFDSKQTAVRRKQFNRYKELVNKYYQELALSDSSRAYDYNKLKVTYVYPL